MIFESYYKHIIKYPFCYLERKSVEECPNSHLSEEIYEEILHFPLLRRV